MRRRWEGGVHRCYSFCGDVLVTRSLRSVEHVVWQPVRWNLVVPVRYTKKSTCCERVDAEKPIQIGDSLLWLFIFSFDLLFSVRRTSCFDYVAGQEGCPATADAAAAAAAAAAASASAIQREERSKVLRERQNEERQRKLEELKQQVNKQHPK